MNLIHQEQDLAVRILKAHLQKKRLASTYLLAGHDTIGEGLALDFSRALLCEKNKAFEACTCDSCQKIERGTHPDVRWLGQDAEARSIKIGEVREMAQWANFKPYEARRKVFIFKGAERLTHEAQNALLKILEEPPGETLFLLLVENRAQLLPAISSRSFEIRLQPQKEAASEETEKALAEIRQKTWGDLLDPYQTAAREEVKDLLDLLMIYFHNQIRRHSEDPERSCRGAQPCAPTQDDSEGLRMTSWLEAWDMVYETREALEANANQKLALTRLTMQLKKIVGARSPRPSQGGETPPLQH